MKLPRERIPYSAIVDRPPLRLPEGKRMAVWTIVNVEEWSIERNMPRTVLPPDDSEGRTLTVNRVMQRIAQEHGRPADLVLSPDGRTVYVKDSRGLVVIDPVTWQIRQELKFSAGGSSVHGVVVTRDGDRLGGGDRERIMPEMRQRCSRPRPAANLLDARADDRRRGRISRGREDRG